MPLGIQKPKRTEVGQKNTPAGFATGMLYTGRVIQVQPVEINMRILHRVEEILSVLRPVFSRQAAKRWFVLLMWGVLLCTQEPAVTSYLNAIGLSEYYYHHAKHLVSLTIMERSKAIRDLGPMVGRAQKSTPTTGKASVCWRRH